MATSNRNNEADCDIAIIGGGLSGLAAHSLLAEAGLKTCLLEASDNLGGRIKSIWSDDNKIALADLGPTWIWPQYQPSASRWMKKLGMDSYPQYESGDAVLDLNPNAPPQHRFLPGQHGIARLVGGPQSFIEALKTQINEYNVSLNFQVVSIQKQNDELFIVPRDEAHPVVRAKRIIVAAPLRVMMENIDWSNLLSDSTRNIMKSSPTWMATQAKVSVVYSSAFWRSAGLSGRVASQFGPLVEVHDHCGHDGEPAALFGFVGWSPQQRKENDLRAAIIEQLTRCFGPRAGEFTRLEIMDWVDENFVCSQIDRDTPPSHPTLLPQEIRQPHCDGRLWFAVAETAQESPGLIDGAFEAGERSAMAVLSSLK